jgi:hypothetical protein
MRALAAVVYLVVMGSYFYAWKEDVVVEPPFNWLAFAGIAVVQVVAGTWIGRLWAAALPFVAILVAVPFGYGEGVGQEAPIWLYYAFIMSLPAAFLVVVGVGIRRLLARRR